MPEHQEQRSDARPTFGAGPQAAGAPTLFDGGGPGVQPLAGPGGPGQGGVDLDSVAPLMSHWAEPGQTSAAPAALPATLQNPRFAGDPQLEAIYAGKGTLKKGARGPHVRKVQAALEDLGYLLEKYHKDASFGKETQGGVEAFQGAETLASPTPGVVDQATMQRFDQRTPHAPQAAHEFREAELNGFKEGEAPQKQTRLTNPRFVGDPVLEMLCSGIGSLDSGAGRPHIWKIQMALRDLNFKVSPNGSYLADTRAAVNAFQEAYNVPVQAREGADTMGENQKGKVGGATMAALDAYAPKNVPEEQPPAEKHAGQRPNYEELFKDGKFEITIALGYDDNSKVHIPKRRQAISYLQDEMDFKLTDPRVASKDEIAAAGLAPDQIDRDLLYFTKDFFSQTVKRNVSAVVKLLCPNEDGSNGAAMLEKYKTALENDDAVLYTGHARAGTGPDFDPHDSTAGNYVMGKGYSAEYNKEIAGAENQLDKTKFKKDYQLLQLWGCTTENYQPHLKKHLGKKGQNVLNNKDIVLTSHPVLSQRGVFGVLSFLRGILAEQSAQTLQDMMNMSERGPTANMHGFGK